MKLLAPFKNLLGSKASDDDVDFVPFPDEAHDQEDGFGDITGAECDPEVLTNVTAPEALTGSENSDTILIPDAEPSGDPYHRTDVVDDEAVSLATQLNGFEDTEVVAHEDDRSATVSEDASILLDAQSAPENASRAAEPIPATKDLFLRYPEQEQRARWAKIVQQLRDEQTQPGTLLRGLNIKRGAVDRLLYLGGVPNEYFEEMLTPLLNFVGITEGLTPSEGNSEHSTTLPGSPPEASDSENGSDNSLQPVADKIIRKSKELEAKGATKPRKPRRAPTTIGPRLFVTDPSPERRDRWEAIVKDIRERFPTARQDLLKAGLLQHTVDKFLYSGGIPNEEFENRFNPVLVEMGMIKIPASSATQFAVDDDPQFNRALDNLKRLLGQVAENGEVSALRAENGALTEERDLHKARADDAEVRLADIRKVLPQ